MIPSEVDRRLAWYVYNRYLPVKVKEEIIDKLLPVCIWEDEEDLDHDELVRWAVEIIDEHFDDRELL
ncbi:hypothetical protein [Sporosarcina sp. OR05]|uniref:hypothetical protein n=1 Tax=Sporosarcina sp. OR05 TaxID=2969819 RepID=UPI003529DDE4